MGISDQDNRARSGGKPTFTGEPSPGNADSLQEQLAQLAPSLMVASAYLVPRDLRHMFDLDEVLQVTFIEAFLNFGRFSSRGPDSLLAWLKTLARNNIRDAVRRMQRERARTVGAGNTNGHSDTSRDFLATISGSGTSPSSSARKVEKQELLEQALARLPHDYERVIRLMDLDGRTARQVSEIMGKSVGAVYMLQARAHERLFRLLGDGRNFLSSRG